MQKLEWEQFQKIGDDEEMNEKVKTYEITKTTYSIYMTIACSQLLSLFFFDESWGYFFADVFFTFVLAVCYLGGYWGLKKEQSDKILLSLSGFAVFNLYYLVIVILRNANVVHHYVMGTYNALMTLIYSKLFLITQ